MDTGLFFYRKRLEHLVFNVKDSDQMVIYIGDIQLSLTDFTSLGS